jgi:hypothetical protein
MASIGQDRAAGDQGGMANIPVFVSMPSKLNERQVEVYDAVEKSLKLQRLEPRTVGRSDPALQSPLGEVYQLARRCSGGLILGFRQARTKEATLWPGTSWQVEQPGQSYHPSAWNQLEAGILFSLGVPMLIFAEAGISGGIFDRGVGNLFIHDFGSDRIHNVIHEWSRHVRNHYMDDSTIAWRK